MRCCRSGGSSARQATHGTLAVELRDINGQPVSADAINDSRAPPSASSSPDTIGWYLVHNVRGSSRCKRMSLEESPARTPTPNRTTPWRLR